MATNKHGYPEPIVRETDDFICVAYLRIPNLDAYKGEYGFDWLEVEPDHAKIEKVQGLKYTSITHYFKEDNELGDYKPVGEELEINVQNEIKKHYPEVLKVGGKYIDMAHVLIKKEQVIELDLHVKCLVGELSGDNNKIVIKSNEQYKLKYKKKEKVEEPTPEQESTPETGKKKKDKKKKKKEEIEEITAPQEQPAIAGSEDIETNEEYQELLEIPLKEVDAIFTLTIKCLDYTTDENGEHFPIMLVQEGNVKTKIGGFTMMQNVPLKLKFRVIALVADETPEADAKGLFQTFKGKEIGKFLNENSLNQAGYEVEIENQAMLDNLEGAADLNEYLFAFNKDKWVEEGLFERNYEKTKKEDHKGTIMEIKYPPMDVIVHEGSKIDYKVMASYQIKLEKLKKPTDYGGLIILANYECDSSEVGAFSRTSPIDHYAVLLYKTNIDSKTTYVHEIGHMLGLQHTFLDTKEKDTFSKKKEDYEKLKEDIQKRDANNDPFTIYSISYRFRKNALTNGLSNCINVYKADLSKEEKIRKNAANHNGTFSITETLPNGSKKSKSATKKDFLAFQDGKIKELKDKIENNTKTLAEINTRFFNDFEEFKASQKFYLLKEDDLKIRNEYLLFEEKTLKQYIKNYMVYPKASTQNIMDYSDKKIKFSNYQIRIMREDYENY